MTDVAAVSARGRFISKGATRHIKGRVHEVTEPVVYVSSNGTTYTVPVGFRTDGASVPRFLWSLYPPFGDDYEAAATLHDYLYQHAEMFFGTDPGAMLSRAEADGLMLEAMEAVDFRKTGRKTIHAGVRFGGWRTWRKYRAGALERDAGV